MLQQRVQNWMVHHASTVPAEPFPPSSCCTQRAANAHDMHGRGARHARLQLWSLADVRRGSRTVEIVCGLFLECLIFYRAVLMTPAARMCRVGSERL